MLRSLAMSVAAALVFAPSLQGQPVDRAALARAAAAGSATTSEKVRSLVAWTNRSLQWTSTDYRKRGVDDVLARGGGNCNEQAMVVVALLDELGVRTRRVRELNVQPENPDRQARAARRVAETGPGASVFGLRHNDHVWIEFWDEEAKEWTPADPTLNLVGFSDWLKARVGFGARPTHPIVASRDMLVPFALVAVDGTTRESRTKRYLIEGFNEAYRGELATLESWTEWTRAIDAVQAPALGALAGTVNLHGHDDLIAAVMTAYDRVAREYDAKRVPVR